MNISIAMKLHDRYGEKVTVSMPALYIVCPTCGGKGRHVDPRIDGNGLDANAFADDPDFREDYYAGNYDVTCRTCHGERVTPEVDVKACTYAQKRLLVSERQWQVFDDKCRAMADAERRAGC